MNDIYVKGAREHNLKNIDVTIPRNKLVVFTGLSGSGKSSLAFDTIFAEGQRRYVESLSSYARQFLGRADKPDVESIEGLSPAISIDQKTASQNPRSTVGTVTEVYDYLRLLFARTGVPHCPVCGREIKSVTIDQIVDRIAEYPEGTKFMLLAPIVRDRKGEHAAKLESLRRDGFSRVKIDGEIRSLDDDTELDRKKRHTISVVVDRLVMKEGIRRRLADSVELCLKLADGLVIVDKTGKEEIFSTNYACPECNVTIGEITPRLFSFNAPYGACEVCSGLGFRNEIDLEKLIPDPKLSLREGAVKCAGWNLDMGKIFRMQFRALSRHYGFSMDAPFEDLPEEIRNIILYGNEGERIKMTAESANFSMDFNSAYEGVVRNLTRRYHTTTSDYTRMEIEKLMRRSLCPACRGKRLKKEVLAVTVGEKNISEVTEIPIVSLPEYLENLNLEGREKLIADPILKVLKERIRFLIDVGLGYLTLDRSSSTLSGGEAQRIRLATQIGSGLTGVLYILDEPSVGLHRRDGDRLIETLKKLRDLGNTLIVVEHDEKMIRSADYIVDIGPGPGAAGGNLVACGTVADIENAKNSVTGDFLSGRRKIEYPAERRKGTGKFLSVRGARENNLKNIDVDFKLGAINLVTGVSGSGKSSLVEGVVLPHLSNVLNKSRLPEGKFDEIRGIGELDKVIAIDQSPIGRTPRSNPATYTGVFAHIRDLFAETSDAKARGYSAGRFSFNVKGGRCENCLGGGILRIEMNFLPDVYVPCEVCRGKRYNRETLEVKYRDKSIYEVLEMTVDEACLFFKNIPRIYNKLITLKDVGLGYIKLGQPATTFSGGEAQRIKLAAELSKRATGRTLYILDEPTTGLHIADVEKLLAVLNRLAGHGNTVIIIEHNPDVIRIADHIVDLGPEGGDSGGEVVAQGTLEDIRKSERSYTGKYI